jgi:glycosyltransferase involved in cell wall biosynthesis/ADP-heptose:LPS heptosyltransferase
MKDLPEGIEEIRDDNGKIIAVRAGGGHKSKLNENAIKTLVNNQQAPPIVVSNDASGGSSQKINPSKILVIRDMALGDILMVLPLLVALKKKYPNSEIHFATKSSYIDFAKPYCDKAFDYKQIEPEIYDSIYNLVLYCERHKDAATKPRPDILMGGVGLEEMKYPIDELDFANQYLNNADEENIKEKLKSEGVSLNKPIMGICTDTSRASKNWAPQKFEELIKRFSKEYPDFDYVFFGSGAKDFTTSDNVFNLTAQLSLREFIAAINQCDIVLTLETGTMHVAGVLGIPFVVICGPSDYTLFTKYYDNFSVIHPDIPCYPCNGECETNKCIRIIGTEFVYGVLKEKIERLNENFTAVYSTKRDVVDIQAKKSINIKKIGIVSVWAEQGLGYLTKNFRDALSNDFEIFIYGTFPMYAPNHAPQKGEWDVPNLCLIDKTREEMDIQHVLTWVQNNHIEAVILMEPTGDKIWQLALELKGNGIYAIGVPMIEIAKADEIFNHAFLDKNISLTQQCHNVLSKNAIPNSVYIPYGISTPQNIEEHSYLSQKKEFVFYFNAGWADERKNTEAILNAFDIVVEQRNDIILFFHSQAGIDCFPLHQQEKIRNNNQIIFSTGSLQHEEILKITQTSDVILIPTKREGLGILFLEALAFGKPIIAANHSPMNEYVKNNINGYLCSGKEEPIVHNDKPLVNQININYSDLADKIIKIADEKKIENFSKNSLQIFDKKYRFEYFSENLINVFANEDKSKKIFFVGNYLYPKIGGAEATALAYLSYLANAGYEVYALCDKGGKNAAVHRAGDFFATTQMVNINGVKIIQSAENVEKCIEHYIEKINPDLILSQLSIAGEVMKIAQQKNIPTVMYLHSVAEHFCSYHVWDCQGGKQDLETCMINSDICMKEFEHYKEHQFDYADYIIANSDFTKRLTKRFYDRDAYVLYPPVQDIERVENPYDKRYILMVNPVIDKGIDIFCAVASMLPQYVFLIVGVNDEAIRAQIINEKAPNATIATMPYVENINDVYKQAKLVCMPSVVQEGFGMVAAEAMYAGIPVITSGRGGLTDVSGDAAIIVEDYTSVEEWIAKIQNILENEELYEDIRKKCIKHSEQFLIENQGPMLLNFLEEILN